MKLQPKTRKFMWIQTSTTNNIQLRVMTHHGVPGRATGILWGHEELQKRCIGFIEWCNKYVGIINTTWLSIYTCISYTYTIINQLPMSHEVSYIFFRSLKMHWFHPTIRIPCCLRASNRLKELRQIKPDKQIQPVRTGSHLREKR